MKLEYLSWSVSWKPIRREGERVCPVREWTRVACYPRQFYLSLPKRIIFEVSSVDRRMKYYGRLHFKTIVACLMPGQCTDRITIILIILLILLRNCVVIQDAAKWLRTIGGAPIAEFPDSFLCDERCATHGHRLAIGKQSIRTLYDGVHQIKKLC